MTRAILLLGLLAATAAVPAPAKAPPTKQPRTLVVALSLASSDLQAGAVRGTQVVLARGFEVDLARALAKRLGVGKVEFVDVARARLTAPGRKTWDIALAQLRPSGRAVDYSSPYLDESQAVLLRRGLGRPTGLAALRGLQLCAERRTLGASLLSGLVRPSLPPLIAADAAALLRRVQAGACDAAVLDSGDLGRALAAGRDRVGAVAGRIGAGVSYAVALERGSALTPHVGRALRALRADGTLGRLRRDWFGADPLRLPALR